MPITPEQKAVLERVEKRAQEGPVSSQEGYALSAELLRLLDPQTRINVGIPFWLDHGSELDVGEPGSGQHPDSEHFIMAAIYAVKMHPAWAAFWWQALDDSYDPEVLPDRSDSLMFKLVNSLVSFLPTDATEEEELHAQEEAI